MTAINREVAEDPRPVSTVPDPYDQAVVLSPVNIRHISLICSDGERWKSVPCVERGELCVSNSDLELCAALVHGLLTKYPNLLHRPACAFPPPRGKSAAEPGRKA